MESVYVKMDLIISKESVFNVQLELLGTESTVTVNHQITGVWVSPTLKPLMEPVLVWLDLLNFKAVVFLIDLFYYPSFIFVSMLSFNH